MSGLGRNLDMFKLLKYNFTNFLKKHLLLIIIIALNLGLSKLLNLIIDKVPLNTNLTITLTSLANTLMVVFIISLIALPVMTFILSVMRYKRKVLGDEGYLIHTLPLKKRDILDAMILNLLIYLIIDIIVLVIAVGLGFGFNIILNFISNISNDNPIKLFLVIALIVITFTTFFNQIILAITLGYSKETNKIKNTIIFGLIIYIANQAFGSVVMGLSFLIITITKLDFEIIMLTVVPLFYLILFAVSYMLIDKSLNEKLNLE